MYNDRHNFQSRKPDQPADVELSEEPGGIEAIHRRVRELSRKVCFSYLRHNQADLDKQSKLLPSDDGKRESDSKN